MINDPINPQHLQNILTISHFYEAHGGGIERVAGHLCRQFARQGATPSWAASDSDALPGDGLKTIALRCVDPLEKLTGLPMPLPGPGAIFALRDAVRSSDAVVIHDALYVTSILGMIMAKRHGKPIVLIQHIAAIPFRSPLLRLLMQLANLVVTRPMLWAADARVFISDTVRHDLLGTPARYPYKLLFNGVDSAIFYPPAPLEGRQNLQAKYNLPPCTRRILFVGRYVEKKGLSILRALAATRTDCQFLLAGSGLLRPAEWGLSNVYDLGVLAPAALAELYRCADLLLLPAVGEGYPLVIQEAMASGLPVICGGPAHRADPNAANWLRGVDIDLNDPQRSAQRCSVAIDHCVLPPHEREAMICYVRERYSWQTMAKEILELAQRAKDRKANGEAGRA
ncbi:glycosyltransferase family 4 protein [Citrobacter sp. Marseille-Q6884]|uniref:glycosyltransferase family 4 protein n=1 Tax=Citrobacter sp. Marseille-Q6884 TaxID=2956786 RepID=UPI0021B3E331|nr:glycosyltransferase family 4 protein [Citrobacter sp. Marseille-Q6884]